MATPDPFFSEDIPFQNAGPGEPSPGLLIDDLYGFKKPISWRRSSPAPEPDRHIPTPTYLGVSVTFRRLAAMATVSSIVFLGLASQALYLQTIKDNTYRALAEGNRLRIIPLPPSRGPISDRTGRILVDNEPVATLTIVPAELGAMPAERESRLSKLVEIIGEMPADIRAYIATVRGADAAIAHIIKSGLTQEEIILLKTAVKPVPGIALRVDSRRIIAPIAHSPSFGHLLGYVGRISEEEYARTRGAGYLRTDTIGKTGIEASRESRLRGRPGRRFLEVDSRGRTISLVAENKTVSGTALALTIDARAQQALEEALLRGLRGYGSARGAAAALDPQNGQVIALVSLPGFDPSLFASGISASSYARLALDKNQPLFPRAISGTYPSGSTIKPIVAAAALDTGIINRTTTILSTGGIRYADRWFFPDWKPGGHGQTDVIKALAESVNTFFYTIGGGTAKFSGLGPERTAAAAARFGLGRTLGIELPNESSGLIPTPEWKEKTKREPWYIGDTYHLAIGQGDVLVTPLQIGAATAAIANGGTLFQPTLVYAEGSRDALTRVPPRILNPRAATTEALTIVREGMRHAVTEGSARGLADLGVPIAGKTGTAEWKDGARPHAWFTGFAPWNNPEIVITVLIEAGGEGSTAAVPVAREFLNWYFTHQPNAPI